MHTDSAPPRGLPRLQAVDSLSSSDSESSYLQSGQRTDPFPQGWRRTNLVPTLRTGPFGLPRELFALRCNRSAGTRLSSRARGNCAWQRSPVPLAPAARPKPTTWTARTANFLLFEERVPINLTRDVHFGPQSPVVASGEFVAPPRGQHESTPHCYLSPRPISIKGRSKM